MTEVGHVSGITVGLGVGWESRNREVIWSRWRVEGGVLDLGCVALMSFVVGTVHGSGHSDCLWTGGQMSRQVIWGGWCVRKIGSLRIVGRLHGGTRRFKRAADVR